MRCFVIEPGRIQVLNPVDPDGTKLSHLIPIEIYLGNAIKKNIYFAVELRDDKYYITAVTKSVHDDFEPLAERRHPETDQV